MEGYRIESAMDNEIYLEMHSEFCLRALKSAQDAAEVTMKLAKKDNLPVLSFHMQSLVVQSVAVTVESRKTLGSAARRSCQSTH